MNQAPPPSAECCKIAKKFNDDLCSCDPNVLQLAVQFTGGNANVYLSVARGFATACKFPVFVGPTCPSGNATAVPANATAAETAAPAANATATTTAPAPNASAAAERLAAADAAPAAAAPEPAPAVAATALPGATARRRVLGARGAK